MKKQKGEEMVFFLLLLFVNFLWALDGCYVGLKPSHPSTQLPSVAWLISPRTDRLGAIWPRHPQITPRHVTSAGKASDID